METTLCYTLSTVSQTLAGALGMLAAFLALRVSALDATIRGVLQELEARMGVLPATMRPVGGSARETLRAWNQQVEQAGQGQGYAVQALAVANHALRSREGLLGATRGAFIVSGSVMGACFLGLALSPWLAVSPWGAIPAFVVAIVGGAGCLFWYGQIVRRALE